MLALSVSPAVAAPVELDTGRILQTDIAAALRQAYQAPTLVEGTSAEMNTAVTREQARLQHLMMDLGYLDATVSVVRSGDAAVLQPTLGRRYTVAAVELKGVRQSEFDGGIVDDLAWTIGEFVGQPATSLASETLGRHILYSVSAQDFALAKLRAVEWVRSGEGTVTAVINLDAGPRMRFSAVTFNGLRRLQADDLQRLVPFRPGDRYEQALIEVLRSNLEALDTIASVNINVGKNDDGMLAIDVWLHEAPANISALQGAGRLGLLSGLAALGGLALARISTQAGIARSRLRLLVWANAACVLAFAGFAAVRLVSFLA